MLNIFIPVLMLSAVGGSTSAAALTQVEPETARSAPAMQSSSAVTEERLTPSPLWSLSDREPTAAMSSGDGVRTTASSVNAILAGEYSQVYSGPREAKEDWARLITRYSADANVVNWVRGEQGRIDTWMAKNFENPARIGGWPMAYVDPTTGFNLQWNPDSPEPAADAPNTDLRRSPRGAWIALSRDYNIAQTLAAARLFRLTGQSKYADWAMRQLDFYASNYAKWPVSTYDGRSVLYFSGLDEAVASFDLMNAARLLDDAAGPERRAKWDTLLFRPMGANLKGTISPMSNIDLWHQCARAAIGMRLRDTHLIEEALGPGRGLSGLLAANVSADNFWIEGTFSYNNYVIEALARLLVHGSLYGYASKLTALSDQAVRLLLVTADYRFDDNTLPNPNDSTSQQEVIPTRPHWMLYRVAPTYWGKARAASWWTWDSLLDPPGSVPAAAPPLPVVRSRNFPSMRQAVLRAGNWQAYIHYGAVTRYHLQQELTTFELNDGAQPITRDAGTVSYGSPYHLEYFSQGAANNVPLIDGAGQAQWAPGTVDDFDASQSLLTVSQPRYQPDASVTRSYRATSAGFVERTSIKIPSGSKRRLGVVFNTTCAVTMLDGLAMSAAPKSLPSVSAMKKYWTGTKMWTGGGQWTAALKCGAKSYVLTIRGPSEQQVYLSTAPNTPLPATRTAIYYETSANQATFETEIRKGTPP